MIASISGVPTASLTPYKLGRLTSMEMTFLPYPALVGLLEGDRVEQNKIKKQGHLETNQEEGCDKNFDGTSGMMEVRVAEILWEGVERHKQRYVTLVSDRDSKACNRICEITPHGEVQIEKEE
ncbi:hypothetical protein PoB_003483900 [Plakobranchus ocellatus]|uniref:Mutator-like transposase domain-containing protein n=1 Tax=Plakobranchus ocellatus TaxID=259542 RepID=A0AAV4APV2_9GAST|nr:hypothetical protein PoB_003483900 [Plakobranchus ocellatus]